MAELFYRAATEITGAGTLKISNTTLPFWEYFAPQANLTTTSYESNSIGFSGAVAGLQGWGDAFMRLIKYHGGEGGHLNEEFSRDTGEMVGAADLTWSYASVLTAAFARAEAQGDSSYLGKFADMNF